jgi:SAM-dependent methyltransferase
MERQELRDSYTITDQERMSQAANYRAWQSRLVRPFLGRRVIEVGCGIGNFTRTLLDREVVVALDSEPECIGKLKERLGDPPNLHAIVMGADDPAFADLTRFQADSCICLNVLEHIADDRRALESMAAVMVPGGAVIVWVPAFEGLAGPIDRNLGHYRRYRRGSLRRMAGAAGLGIEKLHYVNAIGFFGWWINSHLLRRAAQSPPQIQIFDRGVVPWSSRLEQWAPPPFGQSLFAVLRKP